MRNHFFLFSFIVKEMSKKCKCRNSDKIKFSNTFDLIFEMFEGSIAPSNLNLEPLPHLYIKNKIEEEELQFLVKWC